MLLVGTGAGAGMRLVLNSAINEVIYSTDDTDNMMDKNKKASEVKRGGCSKPKAIVIRLNGVVHSGMDEWRAMNEITAQIGALIGPKLPRYLMSDCINALQCWLVSNDGTVSAHTRTVILTVLHSISWWNP